MRDRVPLFIPLRPKEVRKLRNSIRDRRRRQ